MQISSHTLSNTLVNKIAISSIIEFKLKKSHIITKYQSIRYLL
jgi:hypothetical protein